MLWRDFTPHHFEKNTTPRTGIAVLSSILDTPERGGELGR